MGGRAESLFRELGRGWLVLLLGYSGGTVAVSWLATGGFRPVTEFWVRLAAVPLFQILVALGLRDALAGKALLWQRCRQALARWPSLAVLPALDLAAAVFLFPPRQTSANLVSLYLLLKAVGTGAIGFSGGRGSAFLLSCSIWAMAAAAFIFGGKAGDAALTLLLAAQAVLALALNSGERAQSPSSRASLGLSLALLVPALLVFATATLGSHPLPDWWRVAALGSLLFSSSAFALAAVR